VSSSAYTRDFVVACCVMAAVMSALAICWLVNWRSRANRYVDFTLIGRFVLTSVGFVGNVLLVVLYATAACWSLVYKVSDNCRAMLCISAAKMVILKT